MSFTLWHIYILLETTQTPAGKQNHLDDCLLAKFVVGDKSKIKPRLYIVRLKHFMFVESVSVEEVIDDFAVIGADPPSTIVKEDESVDTQDTCTSEQSFAYAHDADDAEIGVAAKHRQCKSLR